MVLKTNNKPGKNITSLAEINRSWLCFNEISICTLTLT